MSRTYRCRHSIPDDYRYRDGAWMLLHEDCPSQKAFHEITRSTPWHSEPEEAPEWYWKTKDAPTIRGSWYNKEKKCERQIHTRRYRRYEKRLMHHERWDALLPYKRTSGWLTW